MKNEAGPKSQAQTFLYYKEINMMNIDLTDRFSCIQLQILLDMIDNETGF